MGSTVTPNKELVGLISVVHSSGIRPVFFDQWQKIDNVEQERGSANGKPREKITNLQEMLDIAHRDR